MKKTITIEVTAEDIAKGKPRSANSCPIAKAIRRHFPHDKVRVGGSSVHVTSRKTHRSRFYAFLPVDAMMFVSRFDDYYKVKPFTSELTSL